MTAIVNVVKTRFPLRVIDTWWKSPGACHGSPAHDWST